MNSGKIFEKNFQQSVPNYALIYRLPDSAQSFGGNDKLRFSRKSPFDFLLWDSKHHNLLALEMKTVLGNSISFERSKDDSGVIHYHQIKELTKWREYGILAGFIIEFRGFETTIFLGIDSFNILIERINKKSINYSDILNSGLPYHIIPQSIKRTNYTYDIDYFLTNINMEDRK